MDMATTEDEANGSFDFESRDLGASDAELLKRALRNEKLAPDLLPFQFQLIERIKEQILLMEENLMAFAGEMGEELMLSLYRMDVDRSQYMLRSYLRTRIQKIENYVLYAITKDEAWGKLSDEEKNYAQRFTDLLQKHYNQTVLSKLPETYRSILKQDESSEVDDMIPEPEDSFVFCMIRSTIGPFQLDKEGRASADLIEGDLYMFRYRAIEKLLDRGRVELV